MEQHSKSSTWTLSGPDCQHWWGYLATASRCDLHLSPSEPRKVHVPHHCARLQILKSATSRRATGEHRLEAWSSFKSWGFNRASTRLKRCWMIWMLPSHPACLLEEHWPRCRRLLQKLPALCSDFFSPDKNTRNIGNPLGPLGKHHPTLPIRRVMPSHTSGMGSTRVTLSCGIKRSRYGWMSLASCSAKKAVENDRKTMAYNSSLGRHHWDQECSFSRNSNDKTW